jgi:hypothetical protein
MITTEESKMAAEHAPINPESNEKSTAELAALASERRAETEAPSSENKAEHAERKHEAAEAARKVIDRQDVTPEPAQTSEDQKPTITARFSQALSYHETMASVQHKLSPVQRQFSRVIHAPAVEKTSEVLESTIMRPSVTLGAVLTALIVGGVFYYFAHRYGYSMRGSELLVSLLVGGVIGVVIEGVFRSLRRN